MRHQKAIWIIPAMLTMVGGPGASALPSGAGSTAKPTGGDFLPVQAQESPRDDLYRGIGVVTDIHPATGSLTINHEEIPGLMPAMEMMLRAEIAPSCKIPARLAILRDRYYYYLGGLVGC